MSDISKTKADYKLLTELVSEVAASLVNARESHDLERYCDELEHLCEIVDALQTLHRESKAAMIALNDAIERD